MAHPAPQQRRPSLALLAEMTAEEHEDGEAVPDGGLALVSTCDDGEPHADGDGPADTADAAAPTATAAAPAKARRNSLALLSQESGKAGGGSLATLSNCIDDADDDDDDDDGGGGDSKQHSNADAGDVEPPATTGIADAAANDESPEPQRASVRRSSLAVVAQAGGGEALATMSSCVGDEDEECEGEGNADAGEDAETSAGAANAKRQRRPSLALLAAESGAGLGGALATVSECADDDVDVNADGAAAADAADDAAPSRARHRSNSLALLAQESGQAGGGSLATLSQCVNDDANADADAGPVAKAGEGATAEDTAAPVASVHVRRSSLAVVAEAGGGSTLVVLSQCVDVEVVEGSDGAPATVVRRESIQELRAAAAARSPGGARSKMAKAQPPPAESRIEELPDEPTEPTPPAAAPAAEAAPSAADGPPSAEAAPAETTPALAILDAALQQDEPGDGSGGGRRGSLALVRAAADMQHQDADETDAATAAAAATAEAPPEPARPKPQRQPHAAKKKKRAPKPPHDPPAQPSSQPRRRRSNSSKKAVPAAAAAAAAAAPGAAAADADAAPAASAAGQAEREDARERFDRELVERRKKAALRRRAAEEQSRAIREFLEQEKEGAKQRQADKEAKARLAKAEHEADMVRARAQREGERHARMKRHHVRSHLEHGVPMHVAIERRYEREVLMPELERRKQELRKIKEKFTVMDRRELADRERDILDRIRQREEEGKRHLKAQLREHDKKMHGLKADARVTTRSLHRVIEEERRVKTDADRQAADLRERLSRQRQYGAMVKARLPPPGAAAGLPTHVTKSPVREPLEDARKIGHIYMRQAAGHIKRPDAPLSTSAAGAGAGAGGHAAAAAAAASPCVPEQPPSQERFVRERRKQGNENMVAARRHIARGPDGCVLPPSTKHPADAGDLRPLRNKVRQLDRVFDDGVLAAHASSDPAHLLEQQQMAFDAVAAVRAKLDLLQHL